jgi:hypothetical protein
MIEMDFDHDYPYAWAEDALEAKQYWLWLALGEFVEGTNAAFTIARAGWERVRALQSATPGSGTSVFVAMWFHDDLDAAWEQGLKPGIADAKYIARRVKEEIHPDKIDSRIIAGIRECRFLVADVTGGRQAVYYEAGFADGLGKAVIWTCREDHKESMCFDTRQYPHILWRDPAHLRLQLATRIKALAL